jgi:protein-S-isoprenylcysteine O-methyltransferase Ste14
LTRPLVYHAVVWRDIFVATVATAAVVELLIQVRTQAKGATDPSYKWMLLGSFAGVALAFAFGAAGHLPGPGWVAAAAGIALMWAGLVLRVWAVRTLGRFFTVEVSVESDQSLVDTGPYARLRHPSYSGLLVVYLGLGLALDSYLSVAAAVLLPLAAIVNRIRHEERLLVSELGRPYREYTERTDRLVPGVW